MKKKKNSPPEKLQKGDFRKGKESAGAFLVLLAPPFYIAFNDWFSHGKEFWTVFFHILWIYWAILLCISVPLSLAYFSPLKQKPNKLKIFSDENGYLFRESAHEIVVLYDFCPFIQKSVGSTTKNVLSKNIEVEEESFPLEILSYGCSIKDRYTFNHMAILRLPYKFPELIIAPQGYFDSSLTFESNQFNQSFSVQAKDEKFAHKILQPLLMEFLINHGETWKKLNRSLFLSEHVLMIVDNANNFTISPQKVEELSALIGEFFSKIPNFLKDQYKTLDGARKFWEERQEYVKGQFQLSKIRKELEDENPLFSPKLLGILCISFFYTAFAEGGKAAFSLVLFFLLIWFPLVIGDYVDQQMSKK